MRPHAFTKIELAVVIAILVILAAILFPTFTRGGHHTGGRRYYCQSNLKQIALGFKQYQQDYEEKFPIAANSRSGLHRGVNWIGQIMPYIKSVS